ncbi:conserved hypothetical protein [Histoplasma capsulatum H143]|uniref:Uncharacterized protein n=1 Tax=Ajellomyces capsulatus (strain H143) TaxID=544712 RepID=C6HEQ7_AJECH|nr:conserved hypothetical protein [Histoplasma capsulatum H143]
MDDGRGKHHRCDGNHPGCVWKERSDVRLPVEVYATSRILAAEDCRRHEPDVPGILCSYDDIKIEAAPDVIASTLDAGTKVVVCNFGAQGSSFRTLVMALKPLARTILPIGIGSEPKLGTPEQMRQNMAENIALGMVQVNASDIFEEAVKKMQQGMGAVAEGWDALCSGGPGPETGLVFKLD